MKLIRKTSAGKIVFLRSHYGLGGHAPFYTARAYEPCSSDDTFTGTISLDGKLIKDIGQISKKKTDKRNPKKEAYELIDLLFPELVGIGLKNEGYAKYTLEDIERAKLQLEPDS